jgi:prevent-host-death family protein
MSNRWQLKDAKARLGRVIDLAMSHGPQIITRRGKDAVVVINAHEYARRKKPRQSLVEFFRKSPLVGIDMQLERSKEAAHAAPHFQ